MFSTGPNVLKMPDLVQTGMLYVNRAKDHGANSLGSYFHVRLLHCPSLCKKTSSFTAACQAPLMIFTCQVFLAGIDPSVCMQNWFLLRALELNCGISFTGAFECLLE